MSLLPGRLKSAYYAPAAGEAETGSAGEQPDRGVHTGAYPCSLRFALAAMLIPVHLPGAPRLGTFGTSYLRRRIIQLGSQIANDNANQRFLLFRHLLR
jgi:hypothetical protein